MYRGAVFSLLMHAVLYGVPYYFLIVRQPEAAVVELDLSPEPRMVPRAVRAAVAAPKPEQAWAPARSAASAVAAAGQPEPNVDAACPPPCPDRPGDFVPAGLAVSPPRWVEGMITEDDYPAEARRLGQQGTVLLAVWVLSDGSVREARVMKGTYESLSRTALAKVRASRFVPALDSSGRAIPCKLMLPIRFELK